MRKTKALGEIMDIHTRMLSQACLSAVLGLFGFLCVTFWPFDTMGLRAAEEQTPKEIIAIQIRRQGFPCKNPQNATRDPEHTKPDEAAWVLTCEDATYRVILIPDMAARVERLK